MFGLVYGTFEVGGVSGVGVGMKARCCFIYKFFNIKVCDVV